MGSITDSYSNLSDVLLSDYKALSSSRKAAMSLRHERDILLTRLLKPYMPAAFRVGPGSLVDARDRQVGFFDLIACAESYPPHGEGDASLYMVDGVAFCLQVRNWAKEDLTQFSELVLQAKTLDRKRESPIFVAAVSLEPLVMEQVQEFLKSPVGLSVDGVLSVGSNVVIRNKFGWYGNPDKVPFVTARGSGESLKAFTFLLLQLAHTFLGQPFGMADYQHL